MKTKTIPAVRASAKSIRNTETAIIRRSSKALTTKTASKAAVSSKTQAEIRQLFQQTCSIERTNGSIDRFTAKHGTFDLLYLDPPWGYGKKAQTGRKWKMNPAFHYPLMSNDELLALDFGHLAGKNAVCAMWVPQSQMKLAFEMLTRNGFSLDNVNVITWHKIRSKGGNAGCPSRGAVVPMHEFLVLAKRGQGLPISGKRIVGVIKSLRLAHSQKPVEFRDELERVYAVNREGQPSKMVELFARSSGPGWYAWGNQAPRSKPRRSKATTKPATIHVRRTVKKSKKVAA